MPKFFGELASMSAARQRFCPQPMYLLMLVLAIAGCAASGDGATWTCTANGLISASYNGSDYAQVHLQGYTTGGSYKVALNAPRTEAAGTTANGTPFKCVKAG